jgi:hypothetical protein
MFWIVVLTFIIYGNITNLEISSISETLQIVSTSAALHLVKSSYLSVLSFNMATVFYHAARPIDTDETTAKWANNTTANNLNILNLLKMNNYYCAVIIYFKNIN